MNSINTCVSVVVEVVPGEIPSYCITTTDDASFMEMAGSAASAALKAMRLAKAHGDRYYIQAPLEVLDALPTEPQRNSADIHTSIQNAALRAQRCLGEIAKCGPESSRRALDAEFSDYELQDAKEDVAIALGYLAVPSCVEGGRERAQSAVDAVIAVTKYLTPEQKRAIAAAL